MGWKASMIVIDSDKTLEADQLLNALGFYSLQEVDEQTFEQIMNPDDDVVYLGYYNNTTIICTQELPLTFMEERVCQAEKVLSELYPNTEIASFVLHSVVNLWGYSICKNGEKIRVRAGTAESGTMVDYGEIIEEEKHLFSQAKIKESGKRVFVFDDLPEDEFEDDQVGENFVFDISQKYLGAPIDGAEDLLYETKFKGYSFSKSKPVPKPKPEEIKVEEEQEPSNTIPVKKKKWWKFW